MQHCALPAQSMPKTCLRVKRRFLRFARNLRPHCFGESNRVEYFLNFVLISRPRGPVSESLVDKKSDQIACRFQKLLSFSSSDKIQYRTQPCKQSGSFAENPVQLLYPDRQFSHIYHSILVSPFFITIVTRISIFGN